MIARIIPWILSSNGSAFKVFILLIFETSLGIPSRGN
jgi:hypothetical protein